MATGSVFITGATAGIGAACARRFAASGSPLVLVGRRGERLETLAASLDVPCRTVVLDVRDRAAVEKAVEALDGPFADVEVLVNNAGLALGLTPAQEADPDDWETMVDTNVKGLLYCTRAILPGMVARRRGHVINLGSVAGSYPYPGGHVYCGTKAFVHQFSLSLRADLLGTNVRVTSIEPGMVETEFSEVRLRDPEAAKRVYEGLTPLTADDIADTIHWVATRPAHVNVNRLEVMPVEQAFSPFAFHREGG